MKNPWMKFYPSDWRADPALRMCSLAARGLWVEMMALMHEADPYGHLLIRGKSPTDGQLAMLVGSAPEEIEILIGELDAAGVFSRSSKGIIFSRRMVRDEKKSRIAQKNGKSGGNPTLSKQREIQPLVNLGDNPEVKVGVNTQKPEARSQKPEATINNPPTPLQRGCVSDGFAAFWQAYPKKVGKGQAEKAYAKAIKAADAKTILSACQAYAAERSGKDPQYTRHPATWLNGQGWLDEGIAPEPTLTGPEFERVNGLELFKWRVYYADWQAGKPWDNSRLGPPPDQPDTRCPVETIEEENGE